MKQRFLHNNSRWNFILFSISVSGFQTDLKCIQDGYRILISVGIGIGNQNCNLNFLICVGY